MQPLEFVDNKAIKEFEDGLELQSQEEDDPFLEYSNILSPLAKDTAAARSPSP